MYILCALIYFTLGATSSITTAGPASGGAPPQPPSPGCTTLQPLYGFPSDGTSTIFPTIVTTTSTVDCRGCSPTIRIFNYSITNPPPLPTTTVTNTEPLTFFEISCLPTQPPLSATLSSTPTSVPTPTASPIPPVSDEGLQLINELRTVNLYVALIANGGFQDVLCSGINPDALSNNTGIDGAAVQNEVCNVAGIQKINPPSFPITVITNQIQLTVAEIALYAVQVAAGYGGVTPAKADLGKLCDEIDEGSLNALFSAYIAGEGTRVKRFVCGAAGKIY